MTDSNPARARLRLLVLLLLFVAPVLGAYALYFWAPQSWRPEGRSHHGRLINPARPVKALTLHELDGSRTDQILFRDKWTLLLIGPGHCDERCAKRLYDTRQVRTALGRNLPRVQRIYVATDRTDIESLQALQAKEHPDLRLLVAEGAEIHTLDRQFTAEDRNPLDRAQDIYLLDPHGNWLMLYTPDDPAEGLLRDLRKLLRLSKIG